jgi:hypothetical protein
MPGTEPVEVYCQNAHRRLALDAARRELRPEARRDVDDGVHAGGARDVIDPRRDAIGRGARACRAAAASWRGAERLDVDGGREIARDQRPHHREHLVGLRDGILGGLEVLVAAAQQARALGARPVGRELLVGMLEAVARADEGETLAGACDGAPVDDALVLGDVDAFDHGT